MQHILILSYSWGCTSCSFTFAFERCADRYLADTVAIHLQEATSEPPSPRGQQFLAVAVASSWCHGIS